MPADREDAGLPVAGVRKPSMKEPRELGSAGGASERYGDLRSARAV